MAFAQWAERERELGIEVEIFRPLESSGALNRFGVAFYNQIQRHLPAAHHPYWCFLEWAGLHRNAERLSGTEAYLAKLRAFRPDWVISVHAHLNHGYLELARATLGPDNVRIGTYCGELADGYGFSRHWVNLQADCFIGATDLCCGAAGRLGMPTERMLQGGFLLRPASYERVGEAAKDAFFATTLKLERGVFTLLLATGAAGANNHLPLLWAMDRAQLKAQVIVLCGHQAGLKKKIESWLPRSPGLRICALPYTDQMPLLLSLVDAIVARPGTGTTSEAILAGCPLIANTIGLAMPQERITLSYLRRFGINAEVPRPGHLPAILRAWQDDPGRLKSYRAAMQAALPPGSPRAILERLLQ